MGTETSPPVSAVAPRRGLLGPLPHLPPLPLQPTGESGTQDPGPVPPGGTAWRWWGPVPPPRRDRTGGRRPRGSLTYLRMRFLRHWVGEKKKRGGMRYCWYRGARAAPLTPVCLCVRPPRGPTPSPVSPNRHPPSPRQGPAPRDRHTPPSSPAIDTGPRRPRLRSLPPPRTPLPRQTEPPGPAPRLGATDTTAPSSPAHSAPPSGRARPLLETLPPGKGRGWNEAPSAAPRRSPWPSWRCGGAALSPGGRAAARATDGDGWSRPAAAHKMAAAAAERGPWRLPGPIYRVASGLRPLPRGARREL